jgi:hypothetical protein
MLGYNLYGQAMSPSETYFIQILRQIFLTQKMTHTLLNSFQQRNNLSHGKPRSIGAETTGVARNETESFITKM